VSERTIQLQYKMVSTIWP